MFNIFYVYYLIAEVVDLYVTAQYKNFVTYARSMISSLFVSYAAGYCACLAAEKFDTVT